MIKIKTDSHFVYKVPMQKSDSCSNLYIRTLSLSIDNRYLDKQVTTDFRIIGMRPTGMWDVTEMKGAYTEILCKPRLHRGVLLERRRMTTVRSWGGGLKNFTSGWAQITKSRGVDIYYT